MKKSDYKKNINFYSSYSNYYLDFVLKYIVL